MLGERGLASAFSWSAFSKADALKRRLLFTIGALLVYRLGSYIPLSGVNPDVMAGFARENANGFLGMLDMFSGGALGRATIMTLNIIPYITASIMVQLLTVILPHFEVLRKDGESGRRKLNQYTRYLTVVLASFEAYGIAVGLEHVQQLVLDPGLFFRLTTVVTLVGSTLFLVWLGEQITSRGVGNGSSMIIYTGIVANLPQAAFRALELGRAGALSILGFFIALLLVAAVITFVVFMERAHRRLTVQYPKRQVGSRLMQGGGSYLPIKLNISGVLPPIFANSVLMFPALLSNMASVRADGWIGGILGMLTHGNPVFICLYVFLIVFFSFFYTSIVFNPEETADGLKKNHGFVPGYKPGEATAQYFDYLLTRLTVLGAAYLSCVCVIPEVVMSQVTLSFFFSGTSVLIVVSVTMDLFSQVQTHLISHHYQGLLRQNQGMPSRRR